MTARITHLSICFLNLVLLVASTCLTAGEPGEAGPELMRKYGVNLPTPAPDRKKGEGEGPFDRLVIRGATVITGTGAPALGPMDVVIEGDRITRIQSVGVEGLPINPVVRPSKGDREIDAHGMYILPGLIDAHVHIGNPLQGLVGALIPAEYIFKLWMGHGITTVREVGALMGLEWTVSHKNRSQAGEITAPRMLVYPMFPGADINDEEAARKWVKAIQKKGADGIKFRGATKAAMAGAIDEARKLKLRTASHHDQTSVYSVNAVTSAKLGLNSMEHWYGLPEALFVDRRIQDYTADYNYNNEQDRFGEAGRLWKQVATRGSERWREVIDELIEVDFTLVPTFTIYEANRDVMRARTAEWHESYTHPNLMKFFVPNPVLHGSYHFDWTTAMEIEWQENFQTWMSFISDYKNAGGRVVAGSDAGFIYKLYGFAYIRELELLQSAGFHPLEVLQAATLHASELLGLDDQIGTIEVGKKADLLIVAENPLANFKVLYGTGHLKYNWQSQSVERVGGVTHTIKDGVVWDARKLLADVRAMVSAAVAEKQGSLSQ
jgi:imidazolonepropionase-like amidohydrolase